VSGDDSDGGWSVLFTPPGWSPDMLDHPERYHTCRCEMPGPDRCPVVIPLDQPFCVRCERWHLVPGGRGRRVPLGEAPPGARPGLREGRVRGLVPGRSGRPLRGPEASTRAPLPGSPGAPGY